LLEYKYFRILEFCLIIHVKFMFSLFLSLKNHTFNDSFIQKNSYLKVSKKSIILLNEKIDFIY